MMVGPANGPHHRKGQAAAKLPPSFLGKLWTLTPHSRQDPLDDAHEWAPLGGSNRDESAGARVAADLDDDRFSSHQRSFPALNDGSVLNGSTSPTADAAAGAGGGGGTMADTASNACR